MSKYIQNIFGFACSPKYFTKMEGGCWIWIRGCTKGGYGHARYDRKQWLAHRLIYIFYRGPIPNGLTLDHLCMNTKCVNPDHLEAVSMKENVLRSPRTFASINKAKTHCPKGHEYTEENLVKGEKNRKCRTCLNARTRIRWHAIEKFRRKNTGKVTKL